jgi:hypothetical protein
LLFAAMVTTIGVVTHGSYHYKIITAAVNNYDCRK